MCEYLTAEWLQPAYGRSMIDYQAVQRFANPDLAEEVGALRDQYAANVDVTWFLLRTERLSPCFHLRGCKPVDLGHCRAGKAFTA